MDAVLQDIRFTVRHLARHRGLTAVVVLSLALGIGANTAIFSLIRSLILRPLPVRDAERLVFLYWGADTWPEGLSQSSAGGPRGSRWASTSRSLPLPFIREIADEDVFSAVMTFAPLGIARENVTLAASDGGERVDGEMVSGNFFGGLGVTAAAGRLITPADEAATERVAVLSHGYWRRRFAANPAVVGTTVTINELPFTVVGVAARDFFGLQPGRMPDVWIPMMDASQITPWGVQPEGVTSLLRARDYWWVQAVARLADGVAPPRAEAAVDAAFQRFVADALPRVNRERPPHVGLEPGRAGIDGVRREFERPLYILMAMVGVILLIACANIAVLLLSASTSRRREFALRLALGAGRARVVRQMLTESAILAAAGAAFGLLLAGWTFRALLYLVPAAERPLVGNPIDQGVLAFAVALSAFTALLFGTVPALVGTRVDLLPVMKGAASGSVAADRPAHRVWGSTLVAIQIALSLVLLVSAALFVRTTQHLYGRPLGLDHERQLVFGLDATQNGYRGERLAALYGEILERLASLPGAEAATAARLRLFSGWVSSGRISIPGAPSTDADMMLFSNGVGPDFGRALGLQLLAGREIEWSDIRSGRRVAVVNESMARHFFGAESPIGRRFSFVADPEREYEVVGIVSDARYRHVRGDFPRTAYFPYTANRVPLADLHMIVRTDRAPLSLATSVRETVRSVDPNLAIVGLDSMEGHIGDSIWRERLLARLASAFGVLALLLASVGLYGTIAYGVGRRRGEFAVRAALGARRSQILWMVLRGALGLAAAGVALGLPAALWWGQIIASQLAGVAPHDPPTFAAAVVCLVLVAGLAGFLPARRATLVEPAVALKQE